MLMEIYPLPMRGSMVMTMVTISPSQRDVSPAKQLHRRPSLVPPRFCLETSALPPESFLLIFSRAKDTLYQKMGVGGLLGGPRDRRARPGGRARPHPRGRWLAPSGTSFAQYFLYILKIIPVEFQDFWRCADVTSQIFNLECYT